MRSWFPTCSYRVEVPSISEQPNQMKLLFGSLGSREGSAPHKYPWERRREKGPIIPIGTRMLVSFTLKCGEGFLFRLSFLNKELHATVLCSARLRRLRTHWAVRAE